MVFNRAARPLSFIAASGSSPDAPGIAAGFAAGAGLEAFWAITGGRTFPGWLAAATGGTGPGDRGAGISGLEGLAGFAPGGLFAPLSGFRGMGEALRGRERREVGARSTSAGKLDCLVGLD